VALLLRRQGITRVRPLAGGFEAWREKGYPVETKPVQLPGIEPSLNVSQGDTP
jgi:3-mercaptopyruvate sulfurtransferase SseA